MKLNKLVASFMFLSISTFAEISNDEITVLNNKLNSIISSQAQINSTLNSLNAEIKTNQRGIISNSKRLKGIEKKLGIEPAPILLESDPLEMDLDPITKAKLLEINEKLSKLRNDFDQVGVRFRELSPAEQKKQGASSIQERSRIQKNINDLENSKKELIMFN